VRDYNLSDPLPVAFAQANAKAMRGDKNKFDGGKLMWDLLMWNGVQEIVRILTFGAEKYGAHSWKDATNSRNRYYAALLRHIIAWFAGETNDPESGCNHLAHAGCNLLFLLSNDLEGRYEEENLCDGQVAGETPST